jgi:hypothetical protein
MTEWSSFHCANPDFVVKSVPDNATFAVNRKAMEASEIFRMIPVLLSFRFMSDHIYFYDDRGHVLVLRYELV